VIGSGDRVGLEGVDPADGQRKRVFDFRSDWHRVDVVIRKRFGPWRFMVSPALRYEVGRRSVSEARSLQIRRDYVVSLRAEGVRELSSGSTWCSARTRWSTRSRRAARRRSTRSTYGEPGRRRRRRSGVETSIGAYATGRLQLGPLLVTPGVRASGFVVGGATEFAVDPRLNARLELGERWSLRFAVGSYSQMRVVRYAGEARLVPTGIRLGSGYLIIPAFFSNFEPLVVFEPLADTLRVLRAVQASARGGPRILAGVHGGADRVRAREQNNGVPPVVLDQSLRSSTRGSTGSSCCSAGR
jgi:hypothetical protein